MPAVGDHQRDLEQHRDKVRDFFFHTQPRRGSVIDVKLTYHFFLSNRARLSLRARVVLLEVAAVPTQFRLSLLCLFDALEAKSWIA